MESQAARHKGVLVAIAGIDGAGKSSLAQGLKRAYEREFGPCVVAEAKDDFVIQISNAVAVQRGLSARAYFGNFAFDFAKSFDIVRDHFVRIEPLLQSGVSVIVPRSVECRLALAMSRGSEPIEKIGAVLSTVPRADVTLRLRADPQVACDRVRHRGIDEETVEDLTALSNHLDQLQSGNDWLEVCGNGTAQEVLANATELLFRRLRQACAY